MKQTTFEEFVDLAKRATFVPVVKELVADLLTPVSAFLKIAEHSDYAFLLESVEGGEHVGRYSFLGKDPFLILRGRNGQTVMERAGVTTDAEKPFVDTLRELMNSFQSPFVPGLPRFTGGAVGYFGYETAAWFEPTAARTDAGAAADNDDAGFMVFDTVLAFDHVQHRILLISNARISPDEDLRSLYQFACAKIEFLESELERALSLKRPAGGETVTLTPNMSQEAYEGLVKRAKEYIAAGDIYQVVLSRRFEAEVSVDAFTVYRALRHVNPSPYMFFIRMGERSIVGASPEMLVRVEGRHAVTHPIAGTRRRGATDEEDVRLADELKRNEKERAEHVMLVDLGRNDIGRVSQVGTVKVTERFIIEYYSHVMHIVSNVTGRIRPDYDALSALIAGFPAGTVSGAPKVRAMEIIDELEPERRGVYAGCIGYFGAGGDMDTCIALRTAVVKDGVVYVQAGGGIVADSDPESEYQESWNKARALMRAAEEAVRYATESGNEPGV